jgi:hypothetical protein
MVNAGENLANLWRTRKGLIILLLAGGLICLLAAAAPQAWATPDQRVSQEGSIPDVDGNDDPPDCERQCDGPIYLETENEGFGSSVTAYNVPVYVTDNITWTKDVTKIGDPGVNVRHTTTVDIVNGHFDPNPVLVWPFPEVGFFDIFFDVNLNGEFNDGDFILGDFGPVPGQPIWRGAYICVEECPVGGATVPARSSLKPLLFAVGALVSAGAAIAIVWGRRRA